MINYNEGEILNLLPAAIKNDSDVIAISYALKKGKEKLLAYCERIKLLSNVDALPEELVDLLALELNSHYYDQDLSLEQKRNIVKATLGWYMQAGTVAAVEEMMDIIFGNGGTVEWYNYAEGPGKPGTFDIFTDTILSPELMEQLITVLRRVKKASAHLRRLEIKRNHDHDLEFGSALAAKIRNTFYSADETVNEVNFELFFSVAAARRIKNVMKGGE